MNYCMYESMHGKQADCNGVCQAADKICPYYFIDTVLQIIFDWKKEAGVESPVLYKFDRKRNKLVLYTTRPGFMIGRAGNLINKYTDILKNDIRGKSYAKNGIDIIECDEGVC